jgi:hypothetical protein
VSVTFVGISGHDAGILPVTFAGLSVTFPESPVTLDRNTHFDGETTSQAVLSKHPDVKIVVPPHKTVVHSSAGDTQRDEHIREIAAHGRIAWQKTNGYGLRAHVELAIQRYKRIIGSVMKARALPQQEAEAWVSASAHNMMTNLGMPVSVKI